MGSQTRLALTFAIGVGLAVPSVADAQAVPRPAGGSSSGSSGSSGGSSGGASSSGSSGGESRVSPPPSSGGGSEGRSRAPSRAPGPTASRGSSGSRAGSPAVRRGGETTAPEPGGFITGAASATRNADGSAVSRSRTGQPITGLAVQREPGRDVQLISFPLYGPWGRYYPWYSGGLGWGFGYYSYDPWRYGATRWMMGRYGMWYDPYAYYPHYPYYYDDSYYGGSYRAEEREEVRTGSIRLKADPKSAKVYIDGALVGTVDEFDGLRNHLEIEVGTHELELRADGYETFVGRVVVEAGKTRTERISLKKK